MLPHSSSMYFQGLLERNRERYYPVFIIISLANPKLALEELEEDCQVVLTVSFSPIH